MKSSTKQILSLALITLCALTLCLTACNRSQSAGSPDGAWAVLTLDGKALADQGMESIPTLNIDTKEAKVWGNLGCNAFNAPIVSYSQEKGELKLGGIAATRMLCEDYPIEQNMEQALSEVDRYLLTADDTLELYVGDQLRVRLSRQ